jgi:hypothetical protein
MVVTMAPANYNIYLPTNTHESIDIFGLQIPAFALYAIYITNGLDFTAVCLRVVDLALERHAARAGTRVQAGDLPR